MYWTQALRQLAIKIAIFAIAAAALAPTLSHVLRNTRSNVWLEVCTVLGAKWVVADASVPAESAPGITHPSDDCPYCALQVHLPVLLSAPAVGLTLSAVQFAVPRLFLVAPRTAHAWLAAQPRAPPHLI